MTAAADHRKITRCVCRVRIDGDFELRRVGDGAVFERGPRHDEDRCRVMRSWMVALRNHNHDIEIEPPAGEVWSNWARLTIVLDGERYGHLVPLDLPIGPPLVHVAWTTLWLSRKTAIYDG